MNTLKERCSNFLATFRTPTTQFCRMIGISCSAYYQWRRCDIELSDVTKKHISDYLEKYDF